jgi:NTP pyrophosphatase (non-canonical NTP hydrolase)
MTSTDRDTHPLDLAQGSPDCGDNESRMETISALIARLQSTLDRWGDTCVYIRRGGLSWGAVALNRRSDDEKNGVFDLQAQHDRDMLERLEQIERLKKDRDEWRQKVWDAEAKASSVSSTDRDTHPLDLAQQSSDPAPRSSSDTNEPSAAGPDDCAERMLLQARRKGQERWTNIYAAQLGQFVGYGCEVRAIPTPQAQVGEKRDSRILDYRKTIIGQLPDSYRATSEDERFLALALCGEAGELGNLIKKRWRDGDTGPDHVEEIRDEIADVRIYLELLARLFDVDGDRMEDRAIDKFRRVVEKRRVPT